MLPRSVIILQYFLNEIVHFRALLIYYSNLRMLKLGSDFGFDSNLRISGLQMTSLVFTIDGRGGHLGHVTSIMSSNFHFHVPESFHTKFGSEWHRSFSENPV